MVKKQVEEWTVGTMYSILDRSKAYDKSDVTEGNILYEEREDRGQEENHVRG